MPQIQQIKPGICLIDAEAETMKMPKIQGKIESCQHCGAPLSSGSKICFRCGANFKRDDIQAVETIATADDSPSSSTVLLATSEEMFVSPSFNNPDLTTSSLRIAPQPTSSFSWLKAAYIFGAVVFVLCLGLTGWLIWQNEFNTEYMTVSNVSWQRSIEIQERQYGLQGDWYLPVGAELESTEQRVHHNNQILLGTEEVCQWEEKFAYYEESCEYVSSASCNMLGSLSLIDPDQETISGDEACNSELVCKETPVYEDVWSCEEVPQYEEEPVYGTWFNYYDWNWIDTEPQIAIGTDTEPTWPDLSHLTEDQREKPNGRTESCIVYFTNDYGNSFELPISCTEQAQYTPGSEWQVELDGETILEVASLH